MLFRSNDTATTEIYTGWYTLSLHDALPISSGLKATAEQCFAMLRPGGVATIIGMIPFGTKIELHGFEFLRGEKKIQGSSMGSNRFRIDMPRLVEHYLKGRLHLDDWISARIKLPEINDGFANMKAGKVLRSVIMFDA